MYCLKNTPDFSNSVNYIIGCVFDISCFTFSKLNKSKEFLLEAITSLNNEFELISLLMS